MSRLHKEYFLALYPPNVERLAEFRAEADESLGAQAAIEAADKVSFEQYLAEYARRLKTVTQFLFLTYAKNFVLEAYFLIFAVLESLPRPTVKRSGTDMKTKNQTGQALLELAVDKAANDDGIAPPAARESPQPVASRAGVRKKSGARASRRHRSRRGNPARLIAPAAVAPRRPNTYKAV